MFIAGGVWGEKTILERREIQPSKVRETILLSLIPEGR